MFQYLKPLRWYLFFNFLFSGLSNICTALLPYFTQELIRWPLSNSFVRLLYRSYRLLDLQLHPNAT